MMLHQDLYDQLIASLCYGCKHKFSGGCNEKYTCSKAKEYVTDLFLEATPRKPIDIVKKVVPSGIYYHTYGKCPSCNADISTLGNRNICDCGQHIDWGLEWGCGIND